MAVLSSSVYVGAALGGVVGGLAVTAGAGLVPVAATLSAVSGLVLALLVTRDGAEPQSRADTRPRPTG
jgi:predicted MFS family arabinose efflux permease